VPLASSSAILSAWMWYLSELERGLGIATNWDGHVSSLSCTTNQLPTYVLEQAQHLIVSSVVGDEKSEVGIVKNSGNPDQARPSARHNTHVLPRILGVFALAVILIVEVCDSGSEGLDSCRGTVLATVHGHRDGRGSLEAAFDVIVDFGRTLAKIGPFLGAVVEAVLGGLFGCPVECVSSRR